MTLNDIDAPRKTSKALVSVLRDLTASGLPGSARFCILGYATVDRRFMPGTVDVTGHRGADQEVPTEENRPGSCEESGSVTPTDACPGGVAVPVGAWIRRHDQPAVL